MEKIIMDIKDWSIKDENNTKTPPDGWPEHQSPSTVNNSARAMMGALRRAYLELPFFNPGGAVSYINGTTFSVADNSEITDFSKYYEEGRRLKFISDKGTYYGNVGSASYNGGVTEVKCYLDIGEIDSNIKNVLCGLSLNDGKEVIGRLPVGMIIQYTAPTLPSGFIFADGKSFDPSIYKGLAKVWKTGEGTYLYGQELIAGVMWPKTPDVRGQFPRYLDNGAGIDKDRELGSKQDDAFQGHEHDIPSPTGGFQASNLVQNAFININIKAKTSNVSKKDNYSEPRIADETRPKNIAFPALVVAWHGVTPAENITMQDILFSFSQMQEGINAIYLAKNEAVTAIENTAFTSLQNFNKTVNSTIETATDEINSATNVSITTVNSTKDTAISTVNTATSQAVSTVNTTKDLAISEVSQVTTQIVTEADAQIKRVENEGDTQAERAKGYADSIQPEKIVGTLYSNEKDLGLVAGNVNIILEEGIIDYKLTPFENCIFTVDYSNVDISKIVTFNIRLYQATGVKTYTWLLGSDFHWLDNISPIPSSDYLITFRRYPGGRIVGSPVGRLA